jgi:hypothetical protein
METTLRNGRTILRNCTRRKMSGGESEWLAYELNE